MARNETITRRQAMRTAAIAVGGLTLPTGALALPRPLANRGNADCPPFTPIFSGTLTLSGKLVRSETEWTNCLSGFILTSDRVAGYTPFYVFGDPVELGNYADNNPYVQITGRISNHELPVLILHQDAAVVPLNGPQPLPDFNAPVSSDPLTSQEEAALAEIFGMYCLTGFANPDAGTDSAYYDQLGEWMSQATFDSSIENRFNSIPFAEYHDPDECTIEGLSLYEIWYRHRTPGLISGGGGGGDNVNDCLFEIGLAIFMFLLGQIVARTTPQAMRLAREEIRTIVRNNGVRTAGANLVAALAAYTASGRHQELTAVLRRISDFVVAMVPLLPGAFYRVIRNAYRWWDYVASIGLSAAFIARAAKFVLTAYSLATALTKIYKACT